MRFTFLGTGTSAGIPTIGCDCAVCHSDDPRDNRLRTSACLEWTDPQGKPRVLLIDAGPDLRQQALRAQLTRCDAILFTHNHVDHTFGLDEVRRFNVTMQAPIDIWAEPRTMDALRRVYAHIFDRQNNVNDSFVATLIPRTLEPEVSIELWGLRVTPIRLLHGRLPVLGFRFDFADETQRAFSDERPSSDEVGSLLPLAYCTDVSAIPPETWPRLTDLNTLVLDALRPRKHPTHFTVGQAVSVAHEVDAARSWFVHMSHEVRHAETDPELPETMNLAFDGLVLNSRGLPADSGGDLTSNTPDRPPI
ncbi:MAG: MBL fold metallo-hydrolase [Planctomycetota bacterium]